MFFFFKFIKKLYHVWVLLIIITIFCEIAFLRAVSPVLKFSISHDRDIWLDTILYSRIGITLINLCWVVVLLLFILFGFGALNWTRVLIQLKFVLTVWVTSATTMLSWITVEIYRNLYHSAPSDLIFKSSLLEITRVWRPDELFTIACTYVQARGVNIPVSEINNIISKSSTVNGICSELDSLIAHMTVLGQPAGTSPYVIALLGVLGLLSIGLLTYVGYWWFSTPTAIPPEIGSLADSISPNLHSSISIHSLRVACSNLDARLSSVEEGLRNSDMVLSLFGSLPIADNTQRLEALSSALAKLTIQVIGLEVSSETSRMLVAGTLAITQRNGYCLNSLARVVLLNSPTPLNILPPERRIIMDFITQQ